MRRRPCSTISALNGMSSRIICYTQLTDSLMFPAFVRICTRSTATRPALDRSRTNDPHADRRRLPLLRAKALRRLHLILAYRLFCRLGREGDVPNVSMSRALLSCSATATMLGCRIIERPPTASSSEQAGAGLPARPAPNTSRSSSTIPPPPPRSIPPSSRATRASTSSLLSMIRPNGSAHRGAPLLPL